MTATTGNAQVVLSWTVTAGATSYSVYRGTASGGESAAPVGLATGTSYTDTGLTNGDKYYYKIAAVNGASTSTQSAEVSATPAFGPPTGLTAAAGDDSVTLTWNASSGATSYNIYQAVGTAAFALITTTSSPTYTATGLTNGTVYSYAVAAVEPAETTAQSSAATVTPVGVQINDGPAVSISGTTATVTWTTNIPAQSLVNYGATTALGTSVPSTTLTTTHSVTVTGLVPSHVYYFDVSSIDGTTTATSANGIFRP